MQDSTETQQNETLGSFMLNFLYVVAKGKRFLFLLIVVSVVATIIYSYVTPEIFKSTATVLPAENSDMLSGLGGISGVVKNLSPLKAVSSLGGNPDIDKFITILSSARVMDTLVKRFDLRKVYDLEDKELYYTYKELTSNLEFLVTDEGALKVSVFDESPKRAAEMANTCIALLNQINTELHTTNAKEVRKFVEQRYEQNIGDIKRLEAAMTEYQKKNGVIAVPEQIEATIKGLSGFYADYAEREIAYNALKKTQPENSPVLRDAEIQFKEAQKKITEIAQNNDKIFGNSKVFIPLQQAPDLARQYLDIYKDLEIQYAISEFVTPIYEQAKIEEVRQTPTVMILDNAQPPDRKDKPKRVLLVGLAFVGSLTLGLLLIFLNEGRKSLEKMDSEKYRKIAALWNPFSK